MSGLAEKQSSTFVLLFNPPKLTILKPTLFFLTFIKRPSPDLIKTSLQLINIQKLICLHEYKGEKVVSFIYPQNEEQRSSNYQKCKEPFSVLFVILLKSA